MTEIPPVVVDLALSGMVSLAAAGIAFRIGAERRLTRLEKDAEQFPPRVLHDKIAVLEGDAAALRPIHDLLRQYGQDAARRIFQGARER